MSEKYKEGLNRNQQLLFPPSLDEYVDKDNSVRAIDDYVSLLDSPIQKITAIFSPKLCCHFL